MVGSALAQTPKFHPHPRTATRRCPSPRPAVHHPRPLPTLFLAPLLFSYSCQSLFSQPLSLQINPKPGASPLEHSRPKALPLPSRLPRPGRYGKAHLFISLPPLVLSCLSFSHTDPLFSIVYSLLWQKRGVGIPLQTICRPSGLQYTSSSGAAHKGPPGHNCHG